MNQFNFIVDKVTEETTTTTTPSSSSDEQGQDAGGERECSSELLSFLTQLIKLCFR